MPAAPGLQPPATQGLYDGLHEHDACGVAFVADMHGRRSNSIVRDALTALHNLDHRGASGAEPNTGDGAGILLQVPDEFLRAVSGLELPKTGACAVGLAFLCQDEAEAATAVAAIEQIVAEEELRIIGCRGVPVEPGDLGPTALSVMPRF